MPGLQEKQLGQARMTTTNATSLYSPADNVTAIIKSIYITEHAGATPTYRIFVDDNGTTYDETTALYFDVAAVANTTIKLETFIAMNNSSGNFAVRASAANQLTFSIFGVEIIDA